MNYSSTVCRDESGAVTHYLVSVNGEKPMKMTFAEQEKHFNDLRVAKLRENAREESAFIAKLNADRP